VGQVPPAHGATQECTNESQDWECANAGFNKLFTIFATFNPAGMTRRIDPSIANAFQCRCLPKIIVVLLLFAAFLLTLSLLCG
jgi:hypothetical protein